MLARMSVFRSSARLAGLFAPAVGSSAPSAAHIAAVRSFHSSRASLALEEFFDTSLVDGAARQPSGRPWEASELRLKSFDDLHRLWFICLKERNMLLSERLYYRQVAQSQPEPSRLQKVRDTMRAIKVVLGERARAQEMLKKDKEIQIRAENEAARLSHSIRDAMRDPVDRLLKPLPVPVMKPVRAPTRREAAAAEALKSQDPRIAAAAAVKAAAKDVLVTYKKFGRKYTVPAHLAPEKPTQAQLKRDRRSRKFFAYRKALMDAPPKVPAPTASYRWATQGSKSNKPRKAKVQTEAAPAAATAAASS